LKNGDVLKNRDKRQGKTAYNQGIHRKRCTKKKMKKMQVEFDDLLSF
jgi:uncharacterized protein (DUF2164 family)